jgi:hypothetical protein
MKAAELNLLATDGLRYRSIKSTAYQCHMSGSTAPSKTASDAPKTMVPMHEAPFRTRRRRIISRSERQGPRG